MCFHATEDIFNAKIKTLISRMCSKLTKKCSCRPVVFIINLEHNQVINLLFLVFIWNKHNDSKSIFQNGQKMVLTSQNGQTHFNLLSANPSKCSNTLKQFVGNSRQIVWVCLTILWGWHLKGWNLATFAARFSKSFWPVLDDMH